jgi:hypothetical protein
MGFRIEYAPDGGQVSTCHIEGQVATRQRLTYPQEIIPAIRQNRAAGSLDIENNRPDGH